MSLRSENGCKDEYGRSDAVLYPPRRFSSRSVEESSLTSTHPLTDVLPLNSPYGRGVYVGRIGELSDGSTTEFRGVKSVKEISVS